MRIYSENDGKSEEFCSPRVCSNVFGLNALTLKPKRLHAFADLMNGNLIMSMDSDGRVFETKITDDKSITRNNTSKNALKI